MPDTPTTAILILIALIIVVYGTVKLHSWWQSWWQLFRHGEKIPAVVKRVSIAEDGDGKRVQRIEAEWTQQETNKRFVYKSSTSGRYLYRKGDVVNVRIDPENPTRYKMKPRLISILFHKR